MKNLADLSTLSSLNPFTLRLTNILSHKNLNDANNNGLNNVIKLKLEYQDNNEHKNHGKLEHQDQHELEHEHYELKD